MFRTGTGAQSKGGHGVGLVIPFLFGKWQGRQEANLTYFCMANHCESTT